MNGVRPYRKRPVLNTRIQICYNDRRILRGYVNIVDDCPGDRRRYRKTIRTDSDSDPGQLTNSLLPATNTAGFPSSRRLAVNFYVL